ncbi:2'-5' RNA ligase family protein [Nocardioides sp. C4-1]|uniref:2'-5' RNA ligase family protein n=1 Tax=Nocardioides sp. C4-1 TaxID=3151851 RepID=UPI003267A2E4
MTGHRGGHAVLAVPVLALDPFVRAQTARQDASFLSADPSFSNAHVTVLGPWLEHPTPADLAAVGAVVAEEPAFEVTLRVVREFPDGLLHLTVEPASPFERLTSALAEAFPATPPYGGRFAHPVPHLTVGHRLTGASPESMTADLAGLLPVRTAVERLDLQWWANDDCHVRHSWAFGTGS